MPESDEFFFNWSDEYSVGIPTIDKQHQELVNMLNRLFIAASGREDAGTAGGILNALMDYTRTHFSLEERLLLAAKYPDVERHKLEHQKMIAKLDELTRRFRLEEEQVYPELLGFLRSWLKEHILDSDMRYSETLRQAGFSTKAWEQDAKAEFDSMVERTGRWFKIW